MRFKNSSLIGTEINGLKLKNYYVGNGRQYFECLCECGYTFQARCEAIKSGATKSCGCKTGDLISSKNRLPDNLGAVNLVLRHYKRNAEKRELKFSLTNDQFKDLIFGHCHYCGSKPTLSKFTSSQSNRRDRELSYNGIDRVDNSMGYEYDNCVSCCHICNVAKSDLSFDEFKSWIKRLVKFNGK